MAQFAWELIAFGHHVFRCAWDCSTLSQVGAALASKEFQEVSLPTLGCSAMLWKGWLEHTGAPVQH